MVLKGIKGKSLGQSGYLHCVVDNVVGMDRTEGWFWGGLGGERFGIFYAIGPWNFHVMY